MQASTTGACDWPSGAVLACPVGSRVTGRDTALRFVGEFDSEPGLGSLLDVIDGDSGG
jgi:hypothetical protein